MEKDLKENTSWLTPYTYQEVKVWDRLVSSYPTYEWKYNKYIVIEKNKEENKFPIKVKLITRKWNWMEYYTGADWFIIDRRSRYKRILDNLLWLIIKSEK